MTDQAPKPATDEEIAEYLELHRKGDDGEGYWNCDLDANVTVRQIIARVAHLRAEVELLKRTIEELEDPHQAALDRARREKEGK